MGNFLISVALTALTTLTACSLYRSDGRKFLETQAYDAAGVNPGFLGCSTPQGNTVYQIKPVYLATQDNADLFLDETDRTKLAVKPRTARDFACAYQFGSETERDAKMSAAVQDTWLRIHQLHDAP